MKKLLSLLLAVTVMLSCCLFTGITVFAADGDYTYKTLTATTAEITGYKGSGGNITIPTTLGGYKVVSIGNQAFYQNKNIKNVTIPDGITKIGEKAFAGSFMTGVKMSDSVETLGNSAFSECVYLVDVTLSGGISTISNNCFSRCTRLEEITIPEGVKAIDVSAFQSCTHLADITLPSTLKTIGEYAFAYIIITELTIPEGTEEIGASAFFICDKLQSVTLPSTLKTIGDWAFCNCYALQALTLAEGLVEVGANAFDSCPIKGLKIPASVTEIDEYAFGYYYDEAAFKYVRYDEFKIECAEDSAGFEYAESNGFAYEIFESDVTTPTTTVPSTPATDPTEPSSSVTEPTTAATKPTAPTTDPTEPVTKPTAPTTDPTEPVTKPTAPKTDPTEPVSEPSSTVTEPTTPTTEPSTTVTNPTEPPVPSNKIVSAFIFDSTGKTEGEKLEEYGTKDGYSATTGNGTLVASVNSDGYRALEWSAAEYGEDGNEMVPIMSAGGKNPWGENPYVEITLSTKGYTNMAISLTSAGSKKCPASWQLAYSLDGENFTDIEGASFTISQDDRKLPIAYFNGLQLPEEVADCDTVTLRLYAVSDVTVSGGTTADDPTGGELVINNIIITGATVTEPAKGLMGDTDLDGKVTVKDATLIQKHLADLEKISDEGMALSDTNRDGKLTVGDATTIQKLVAGLIEEF